MSTVSPLSLLLTETQTTGASAASGRQRLSTGFAALLHAQTAALTESDDPLALITTDLEGKEPRLIATDGDADSALDQDKAADDATADALASLGLLALPDTAQPTRLTPVGAENLRSASGSGAALAQGALRHSLSLQGSQAHTVSALSSTTLPAEGTEPNSKPADTTVTSLAQQFSSLTQDSRRLAQRAQAAAAAPANTPQALDESAQRHNPVLDAFAIRRNLSEATPGTQAALSLQAASQAEAGVSRSLPGQDRASELRTTALTQAAAAELAAPRTERRAADSAAGTGSERRFGANGIEAGLFGQSALAPLAADTTALNTTTGMFTTTANDGSPLNAAALLAPSGESSLSARPISTAQLPVPFATPNWAAGFNQQVVALLPQQPGGMRSAELRLDPPDLGPVRITLHLHGDILQASFSAALPQVRQAIEQALPQLQQQLADAGVQLGQTSVGEQHQPGLFAQADESTQANADGETGSETADASASNTPVQRRPLGLVDTFA